MPKRKRSCARSVSSYRRRLGIKQPRRCILIVCEGAKTEPKYFRSLCRAKRLSPVEVEIIEGDSCGSAPMSVVEYALRLRRERKRDVRRGATGKLEYDEVWCVFDQENPRAGCSAFYEAVDKATGNSLKLAVSTPAFEYWLLLHFVYTDRPFRNAGEVISALKEYLPDYEKGKNIFADIAAGTQEAIQRAGQIWSNQVSEARFPNPSSLVFKLAQKLLDMVSFR
jgi:hypothetical protein